METGIRTSLYILLTYPDLSQGKEGNEEGEGRISEKLGLPEI